MPLCSLGEEIKGGRWGRMLQAAQLMGYEPQRLSIQLDRPIEAREQPSDGGDLCGSGQIARRELRLKALLVVIANGPWYWFYCSPRCNH